MGVRGGSQRWESVKRALYLVYNSSSYEVGYLGGDGPTQKNTKTQNLDSVVGVSF